MRYSYEESLESNASSFYKDAKKYRNKIKGAQRAIKEAHKRIKKQKSREERIVKKEWYEKYHWFISSEGNLCIGGNSATANEELVKKHTEKDDLLMHTEVPGSPFTVIKGEGEQTLEEAADFTACYSKAWRQGLAMIDVFHVKPEQVTKEAQAGEYLSKGAFMIYGKKHFHEGRMELAIGNYEGKVMAGPESAVKKHCKKYVIIIPGQDKTSDVGKEVRKQTGLDLNEIIKQLPAGGSRVNRS